MMINKIIHSVFIKIVDTTSLEATNQISIKVLKCFELENNITWFIVLSTLPPS